MWKPDYATADELAAYLRVSDQQDATPMAAAVASASRAVDDYTGRQFGVLDVPAARYYRPWFDRDRRWWVLDIDDLMTTTGLVVAVDDGTRTYPTQVGATGYALLPFNAAADGESWTSLAVLPGSSVQPSGADAEVQVTARFGWSAVPPSIKAATLLQASRFLARRDSPYGVAGSPLVGHGAMRHGGGELRLRARVDPDVEAALDPYRRGWWLA